MIHLKRILLAVCVFSLFYNYYLELSQCFLDTYGRSMPENIEIVACIVLIFIGTSALLLTLGMLL